MFWMVLLRRSILFRVSSLSLKLFGVRLISMKSPYRLHEQNGPDWADFYAASSLSLIVEGANPFLRSNSYRREAEFRGLLIW